MEVIFERETVTTNYLAEDLKSFQFFKERLFLMYVFARDWGNHNLSKFNEMVSKSRTNKEFKKLSSSQKEYFDRFIKVMARRLTK